MQDRRDELRRHIHDNLHVWHTGKPKGAVHVHGGFQVKVAEEMAYQVDLHEEDILFWFTDMGWIMAPWEIVGALSLGGTILIYDGAPDYPTPDRLWEVVEENKATILGSLQL